MLVKDVMTKKENLVMLSPMASIRDILNLMKKTGVRSIIIDKTKPSDAYGILTYKNILKSIVAEDGDIDMLNAYDICSKPALQISHNLDIKYAAQMMITSSIKRLLVIDNNEISGILTMTDIIEAVMELAED